MTDGRHGPDMLSCRKHEEHVCQQLSEGKTRLMLMHNFVDFTNKGCVQHHVGRTPSNSRPHCCLLALALTVFVERPACRGPRLRNDTQAIAFIQQMRPDRQQTHIEWIQMEVEPLIGKRKGLMHNQLCRRVQPWSKAH